MSIYVQFRFYIFIIVANAKSVIQKICQKVLIDVFDKEKATLSKSNSKLNEAVEYFYNI
jgi:hypothetical protein